MLPLVVLDTNVLVAGLRSRRGASFALLQKFGQGEFEIALSVPLLLEYEEVLLREGMVPLGRAAVEAVLDFLCKRARQQSVFYLWRPVLRDPKDDLVLELALNAGAERIITFNERDFAKAQPLGVRAQRPRDFLESLQ
jgi:putative PIN family toxin of toxin-antitoxin system